MHLADDLESYAQAILPSHVDASLTLALTPEVPTAAVLELTEETIKELEEVPGSTAREIVQEADCDYGILVTSQQVADPEYAPDLEQGELDQQLRYAFTLHEVLHILKTATAGIHDLVDEQVDEQYHEAVHSLINAVEDGAIETELRTSDDWSDRAENRIEYARQVTSQTVADLDANKPREFTLIDAIEQLIYDDSIWTTGIADVLRDPNDARAVFDSDAARDIYFDLEGDLYGMLATVHSFRSDEPDGLYQNDPTQSLNRAQCVIDFWHEHIEPHIADESQEQQEQSPQQQQSQDGQSGEGEATTADSGDSGSDSEADRGEGASGGESGEGSPHGESEEGSGEESGRDGGEESARGEEDGNTEPELTEDDIAPSQDINPTQPLDERADVTDAPGLDDLDLEDIQEAVEQAQQSGGSAAGCDDPDSAEGGGSGDENSEASQPADDDAEQGGDEQGGDAGGGDQSQAGSGGAEDDSPQSESIASAQLIQKAAEEETEQSGLDSFGGTGDDGDESEADTDEPGEAGGETEGGDESVDESAETGEVAGKDSEGSESDETDSQGSQSGVSDSDSTDTADDDAGEGDEADRSPNQSDSYDPDPDTREFDPEDFGIDPGSEDDESADDGGHDPTPDSPLPDAFEEIVEDMDDVDFDEMADRVGGGRGAGDGNLEELKTPDISKYDGSHRRWSDIPEDGGSVRDRLEKSLELAKLSDEVRGVPCGEFDPRLAHRLQNGNPNVFSQPIYGDEKEYHIIFILDRSGSMTSYGAGPDNIDLATNALTRLTVAAEDLDINVSVIDFYDDEARLVKPPELPAEYAQEALLARQAKQGTPLSDALELSQPLINLRSERPIIITLTDGIPAEPEDTIDQIEQIRAPVCSVLIDTDGDGLSEKAERLKPKFTRVKTVTDAAELDRTLENFAGSLDGL